MSKENIFNNSLYEDDKDDETIVLDYDLDVNERKETFQNYDLILCEKCNRKIDNHIYYCKDCYEKETVDVERKRILFEKCKECFQVITNSLGCKTCTQNHFQQYFD